MSPTMPPLTASSSSSYTAAEGAAVNRRKDVEARAHGSEEGERAHAPKGRHALLAALSDALEGLGTAGADAAPAAKEESSAGDRPSKQTLHAFVHELFAALRPVESEGRSGRGFAWGRSSSADLAQRIEAFVQRLQGAPQAPSEQRVVTATPQASTPEVATLAPAATVPATPGEAPATATSTAPVAEASIKPALRVGVDPLLSAFQQLLAARHPADDGGSGDGTDALVSFLHRMAQALGGQGASGSPVAGTLLDVTA